MATIDWPTTRAFSAAAFSLQPFVSRSSFTGFLTGVKQRRSNLVDRLRATITLPPCWAAEAAEREALLMALLSTGDWLRLPMPHRPRLRGSMVGGPLVAANAAAGARSISIVTTAGATVAGGDWLGVGGNLLQCAYGGAVANLSGVVTVPLVLPLQRAVVSGAAVAYVAPTGVWQLDDDGLQLDYTAPALQQGIALPLLQVIV
jgi:hypothetical protein